MPMHLLPEEKKLVHDGLWAAMDRVKAERTGAMHEVERLLEIAIKGDKLALLNAMRSSVEEGAGRP
jgi:hypothetical protein